MNRPPRHEVRSGLHLIYDGGVMNEAYEQAPYEYVRQTIPYIIDRYSELGLAPPYLAILGRYLDDTRIRHDIEADTSTLELRSTKDEDGDTVTYHREANISLRQLKTYARAVVDTYEHITGEKLDRERLSSSLQSSVYSVAYDWVFFELTADAAAASCYMQHRYDRYVSDYGTSQYFRADLEISQEYLAGYTDGNPSVGTQEADHRDFRAGVALIFIHDAILRSGLLDSSAKAKLFTLNIKENYPGNNNKGMGSDITPMFQGDVVMRLSGMEPRQRIFEDWDEYYSTVFSNDDLGD